MRRLWTDYRYRDEELLAISHSEVELALADPAGLRRAEAEFYDTDEECHALTLLIDELAEDAVDPRWQKLCAELDLAAAESQLLALALAAELVPALRRVYGYLLDDTVALDPTPALVADLWRHPVPPRFDSDGALLRWALARPVDPARDLTSSAAGWAADPLLLDHLLGDPGQGDPAPLCRRVAVEPAIDLHPGLRRDITRYVRSLARGPARPALELELLGPRGAGKAHLAAQVADDLGAGLLAADGDAIAVAADPVAATARIARAATLEGALVAWQNADRLPPPALALARRCLPLAFLTAESALPPAPAGAPVRCSFTLPPPGRAERLALWAQRDAGHPPEPVAKWGLRPAEIDALAQIAAAGEEAAKQVARGLLLDIRHELLVALPRPYTWDDLVVAPALAAHLHEFEAQARTRSEVLDGWGLAAADAARPRCVGPVRRTERDGQDDGRPGAGALARPRAPTASTSPAS